MKAIVSVIGRDKRGIIAKVSGALYDMDVNIEDISQTIMAEDYFTMIMMVNMSSSQYGIDKINTRLQLIAVDMGVEIRVQSEDIFNSMHKL